MEQHGRSNSREYHIWENMKSRCSNPKNEKFAYYGGRGIRVCAEWSSSFRAFYETMGPAPTADHTLDRIDGERGYEPGNCRWATRREQSNNISSNRLVSIDGETMTVSQWSARTGIPQKLISQRLSRGWSYRDAVLGRGNMMRTNSSGYRGVSWHKGAKRWISSITLKGKAHYLGLFDDPAEAHAAYLEARDGTPVYAKDR